MTDSAVPARRVRAVNRQPVRASATYVLYWMISARRMHDNYALDRALEYATRLQKPLLVLEALRASYPYASDRLHRFVLDGKKHSRSTGRLGRRAKPAALAALPIDHSVPVVGYRGGPRAARSTLAHFVRHQLDRYEEDRSLGSCAADLRHRSLHVLGQHAEEAVARAVPGALRRARHVAEVTIAG